ncbi:UDP-N-acetylmuramoyl-L-alanine--D-glutamate ligase [Patescibacteria group bacterium]|nr:UDP-N-acetylmuramoyl-L-alanine--D-glutamate ligase [Patescibacteria group bacterium]
MKQTLIDRLRRRFQGKKVLVVGLGIQGGGVGLVRFFSSLGARVTVTDAKSARQLRSAIDQLRDCPVSYRFGPHQERDFLDCDVIFTGPSVKRDLPALMIARKKRIPIETELAFFMEHCPAKLIGVTGTRGKSTTSAMIYQVLKAAGKKVFLAGNVSGQSTINLLNVVDKNSLVVLELSSWQLAGFHAKRISPSAAVFTNLYPDHLNYYRTLDEYHNDKKAIYLYQRPGDLLVLNRSLAQLLPRKEVKGRMVFFRAEDFPAKLRYLRGRHNQENAAAALVTLEQLGIKKEFAIKQLLRFTGLVSRQETIAKIGTVEIVNDTTSTTPTATIRAIDSFYDKNIVLILGGNSKNLPVDGLLTKLPQVKKIVLLAGSFTDQILPRLRASCPDKITPVYHELQPAVATAYRLACRLKPSYLLFSPGATSFAMFNNEFHRGEEFVRICRALTSK